jgi:hypothetical protein
MPQVEVGERPAGRIRNLPAGGLEEETLGAFEVALLFGLESEADERLGASGRKAGCSQGVTGSIAAEVEPGVLRSQPEGTFEIVDASQGIGN